MPLYWEDAEDIADALRQAHPTQDPADLAFPTLDRMICDLPDFADDPARSSDQKREAILTAWIHQARR